ncbi:MAG: hypothetical protein H0V66_11050 [Bdellovibrionales bacterium]|nr:hypothetical protein [Bdellovibrionales bacterium]
MLRIFILGLMIFSASCAHVGSSQEVKTFVQSMRDQYQQKDPQFIQDYERYLASVENVYEKYDKKEKFRSYLDSLNNNFQILAHQESALPALYKQEKGRALASGDRDFEIYKTQKMNALYEKLFSARELKIKDEVGEEVFQNLDQNHKKFAQREKNSDSTFPL